MLFVNLRLTNGNLYDMKYELDRSGPHILLSVEATFTLLDFIMLFLCLLLSLYFALFLAMFAFAVLIKVFTRYEFEFDGDRYEMRQYIRVLSYFRIRRYRLSFDEIRRVVFSNLESGEALLERGIRQKEWFTIKIVTDSNPVRIVKSEPDDLEEMNELFLQLKGYMDKWFTFDIEIIEFGTND